MGWTIWITAPHTGHKVEVVGRYSNHGHAVARLRGLRRQAWLCRSELNYTIQPEKAKG